MVSVLTQEENGTIKTCTPKRVNFDIGPPGGANLPLDVGYTTPVSLGHTQGLHRVDCKTQRAEPRGRRKAERRRNLVLLKSQPSPLQQLHICGGALQAPPARVRGLATTVQGVYRNVDRLLRISLFLWRTYKIRR